MKLKKQQVPETESLWITTKLLAKWKHEQQAINNRHKIRDPRTNEVISTPEETENTFQRYYQELYTEPGSADEDEMKVFLNLIDLPSTGTSTRWSDITMEEVKDAIKTLKTQ